MTEVELLTKKLFHSMWRNFSTCVSTVPIQMPTREEVWGEALREAEWMVADRIRRESEK